MKGYPLAPQIPTGGPPALKDVATGAKCISGTESPRDSPDERIWQSRPQAHLQQAFNFYPTTPELLHELAETGKCLPAQRRSTCRYDVFLVGQSALYSSNDTALRRV